MGIFSNKKKNEIFNADSYLKMMTAYRPAFTTWNGCLYESELVRSAIDARARHISKLKVEINGSAKPSLQSKLRLKPNKWQTWSQFLYRASTIWDICNNVIIVPTLGEYNEITGYFPICPTRCEVVTHNNELWLRYHFSNGVIGAMELNRCVLLTKHQYKSDYFGESNSALNETMKLIHMQNQGIEEAVKNASTYRFMAQMTNFSKATDLAAERKRFTENNLRANDGNDGILLFPNTYNNIKQIDSKPYTVDAGQMQLIQTNVYNYFGVNEDILQNKAYGDSWSAYYEGAIEPFAIQFSEAMTKAIFTEREQAQGSLLMATSSRLQYMTNSDKLNVSSQMLDRGIMSINEIREIWNLEPVAGGDARIIRGEYWNADEKITEGKVND